MYQGIDGDGNLMQVASNAAILVEQVFDCVLHGVVGGSNDAVLREVHCGRKMLDIQ